MNKNTISQSEWLPLLDQHILLSLAPPVKFAFTQWIGNEQTGVNGVPPRFSKVRRVIHDHDAAVFAFDRPAVVAPI